MSGFDDGSLGTLGAHGQEKNDFLALLRPQLFKGLFMSLAAASVGADVKVIALSGHAALKADAAVALFGSLNNGLQGNLEAAAVLKHLGDFELLPGFINEESSRLTLFEVLELMATKLGDDDELGFFDAYFEGRLGHRLGESKAWGEADKEEG